MHAPQPEVRAALLASTPRLNVATLPSVLDSIVDAVSQLAPGTEVGICAVDRAGTVGTLAGTDRLVFALDNIQSHLDEGPSLTAIREDHTVIVDDTESEHRWPSFTPYAVGLGLRSYLGVTISIQDKAVGALSLYATTHTRLDADRLALAKVFAAHAAVAMKHPVRENDLSLALQSCRTIGKAIGVVMERFGLDDDEAFAYLVRLSQRTNLKLRDVAGHMVKQSNDLRHCG